MPRRKRSAEPRLPRVTHTAKPQAPPQAQPSGAPARPRPQRRPRSARGSPASHPAAQRPRRGPREYHDATVTHQQCQRHAHTLGAVSSEPPEPPGLASITPMPGMYFDMVHGSYFGNRNAPKLPADAEPLFYCPDSREYVAHPSAWRAFYVKVPPVRPPLAERARPSSPSCLSVSSASSAASSFVSSSASSAASSAASSSSCEAESETPPPTTDEDEEEENAWYRRSRARWCAPKARAARAKVASPVPSSTGSVDGSGSVTEALLVRELRGGGSEAFKLAAGLPYLRHGTEPFDTLRSVPLVPGGGNLEFSAARASGGELIVAVAQENMLNFWSVPAKSVSDAQGPSDANMRLGVPNHISSMTWLGGEDLRCVVADSGGYNPGKVTLYSFRHFGFGLTSGCVQTTVLYRAPKGIAGTVWSCAAMADVMLAAGIFGGIRVFNIDNPRDHDFLGCGKSDVLALQWIAEKTLIAGTRRGFVDQHDIRAPPDPHKVRALGRRDGAAVTHLQVARGAYVVSRATDGSVCLWDLRRPGDLLVEYQPGNPKLFREKGPIAVCPDERLLFAHLPLARGAFRFELTVWDIWTGQLVTQLGDFHSPIITAEFCQLNHRRGPMLLAGVKDGLHYLQT